MTKFYLYELRFSGSNDCRILDCIIEAESEDKANEMLSEHFEAEAKANDWEHDGNFCGYFFPCDCEMPELPEEEIPCSQCEMVSVNGVPCHETGCPVDAKRRRIERRIDNFECQGHGGLMVSDEPKEYETEEQAEAETSYYHSRYYV